MENIKFLFVDLFCGAGGTTTGIEQAKNTDNEKIAKVIACVNHDPKAINSHYLNHPHVKHFTEDIRTLNVHPLNKIIGLEKSKYPNAFVVLWASLECTNFSNAKGGKPRDADSRWFTETIRSEGFAVSGHFGLQPYGEGLSKRKLIYIDDFLKKGYSRKAKIKSASEN